MISLSKEEFWDGVKAKYPEGFKYFAEWVDTYKSEVGWNKLFGDSLKFHHLPIDMQMGIIARFDWEMRHGKASADRKRTAIPSEVDSLIGMIHTILTKEISAGLHRGYDRLPGSSF